MKSTNRVVTTRKPLDLMQKWFVVQYWSQQKPLLTRASFVVLLRLLDRQNTKTGRCDPSAIGLAEETGFSERSIRSAFKELESRGAVKRCQRAKRARNHFLIFSRQEIGQNARIVELRPRQALRPGMKSISRYPEMHCRANLQRTAPETIKETIKKKDGAEKVKAEKIALDTKNTEMMPREIGPGEFERRVAKVFEKKGFGYVGLLTLPTEQIERAYALYSDGSSSFGQSVGELLAAYESELD